MSWAHLEGVGLPICVRRVERGPGFHMYDAWYILSAASQFEWKHSMKRISVFTLLLALTVAWSVPARAQRTVVEEDARQSQKAANKAAKKQQKMSKKAAKQQKKAMKEYDKKQRKLIENANQKSSPR